MKHRSTLPISLAALSFAVLLPASTLPAFAFPAPAQSQTSSQSNWTQNNAQPRGQREAMRMVPARAALDHTLVADQVHPGDQFRATLAHKVQLHNGTELPSGTVLLGTVATDDMNESGTSKLALRFTEAKLKDGQTVPIKATIVGVARPEDETQDNYPVNAGSQVPNDWNDGTLAVDEIDAMHGVDLHSKIASRNSGVFVSTTKDNMKLKAGSELELAIAQQNHPMTAMNTNQ